MLNSLCECTSQTKTIHIFLCIVVFFFLLLFWNSVRVCWVLIGECKVYTESNTQLCVIFLLYLVLLSVHGWEGVNYNVLLYTFGMMLFCIWNIQKRQVWFQAKNIRIFLLSGTIIFLIRVCLVLQKMENEHLNTNYIWFGQHMPFDIV